MKLTPQLIREARAFLRKRRIPSSAITPRRFAATSVRLQKSFTETLNLITDLVKAAQGQTPPDYSPIATDIARRKAA